MGVKIAPEIWPANSEAPLSGVTLCGPDSGAKYGPYFLVPHFSLARGLFRCWFSFRRRELPGFQAVPLPVMHSCICFTVLLFWVSEMRIASEGSRLRSNQDVVFSPHSKFSNSD